MNHNLEWMEYHAVHDRNVLLFLHQIYTFSFKIGACDWQMSLQAMEKMVESLLVGFLILICMMLAVSLIVFWDCFQTSRIGKFFLNTSFFHYIWTWSGNNLRIYLIGQII